MLKRLNKAAINRKKIAFIITDGEIEIVWIPQPRRHGLPNIAGVGLSGGNPRSRLGSWVRVIVRPFPFLRDQHEVKFREVELPHRSKVPMRCPRVVCEVRSASGAYPIISERECLLKSLFL